MATAGTLLSDLGSGNGVPVMSKDDDLVNRILADMNQPSPSNPVMNMQSSGYGSKMIQAPNPNLSHPSAMDPATATAHMIGKEYPSPADFASMMHAPSYAQHGSMYSSNQMNPPQSMGNSPTLIDMTKGNFYSDIIIQLKQPILVAIIVFLVSLPALNVLIGHYLPSMLRMGGDLTTAGLVIKAAIGGFLFWFIQKVLVPLMMV